jgi:hypothetical protein
MPDIHGTKRTARTASKDATNQTTRSDRRAAAFDLVEANLPAGWTWRSLGEVDTWTAEAMSPEGMVIRVQGRTLNGALLALARKLGR